MKYQQQEKNDVFITLLQEGLDLRTSKDFQDIFEGYRIRGCRKIVLDLAGVDFLDSHSLSLILMQAIRVRKLGGDLRLSRIPPQISRIFELVRLKDFFHCFPDPELAISSYLINL